MKEKPIVLLRQEFADSICDIVNSTPLPAFVMRSVLRDLDKVLAVKEQQEYQLALSMQGKEEPEGE